MRLAGAILPPGAMFARSPGSGRARLISGLLAAGLQVLLVLLLLYGLAATGVRLGAQSALTSLDLRIPPEPPVPARRPAAPRFRAAAPPARQAQAAPIVAPRGISLAPPPLIAVAAVAGHGVQSSAGAAIAGSGSGAGGDGAGAGEGGNGGGGGAELISGRIKASDTPASLMNAPFSGTTSALVLIDAAGKVSDCRIRAGSGNATLDALTCQLLATRFRFRPARDPAGRAIAGKIIYQHDWEVGGGFDSDPPSDAKRQKSFPFVSLRGPPEPRGDN